MSSSQSSEQWFELTFLIDGKLDRVAFLSPSPSSQADIGRALDEAIQRFVDLAPGQSHGLSLLPLSSSDPVRGSAQELLQTLSSAVSWEEDGGSPVWDQLQALAQAIDSQAQNSASTDSLLVEFVWDNGGGDDNPFGDGFVFAKDKEEQRTQAHAFVEALEQWGEGEGFWYDFTVSHGSSVDPHEGRMHVEDFIAWVEESPSPIAQAMAPLAQAIGSHHLSAQMDSSLAAAQPSRSSLRF